MLKLPKGDTDKEIWVWSSRKEVCTVDRGHHRAFEATKMDELTWGIKKRSPRTKLRALPGLVVGNLKWNQQRILRGGTRRQGETATNWGECCRKLSNQALGTDLDVAGSGSCGPGEQRLYRAWGWQLTRVGSREQVEQEAGDKKGKPLSQHVLL